MKTLDPRVQLLAILLLTTLALLSRSVYGLLAVVLAALALTGLLGVPMGSFLARFRAFAGLLAALVLAQLLFVRTGAALIAVSGVPLLTADGLRGAAMLLLRLLVLFLSASIAAGESSRRMVQGLIQLGIPYLFAFLMNVALRFLPLFRESLSDSLTSIRLRGVEISRIPLPKRMRLYTALLLPVVADAVEKSQSLAVAMAARGFGAYKTRTSLHRLAMRRSDWLVLAALALLGAGALYWSIHGS